MDGGRISKLFLSFISLAAAAFAWCCCVAVVPLYSFNEILCFKKVKEKWASLDDGQVGSDFSSEV